MPLYEYECKKCHHRFEKIQKFSDPHVKKCPKCGGPIEQVISAPAVQFKGSGWYVTDYAKKSSAPSSSLVQFFQRRFFLQEGKQIEVGGFFQVGKLKEVGELEKVEGSRNPKDHRRKIHPERASRKKLRLCRPSSCSCKSQRVPREHERDDRACISRQSLVQIIATSGCNPAPPESGSRTHTQAQR